MNGLIAEALNCGIGKKPKLAPIDINTYGKYTITAESKELDGFDEVNVDLKDRYNEGYQDGKNSIAIDPLNVTQNGIYTHPSGGYSPVVVNVGGNEYFQGLVDEMGKKPDYDKLKSEDISFSSGVTYSMSVSDISYEKKGNWGWTTYHVTVINSLGEKIVDDDASCFDTAGGTAILTPYTKRKPDGSLIYCYPYTSPYGGGWSQYWQEVPLP